MSTDIDAMKAAVVAQMRALGLTSDDIIALLDDGAPPPITVAEFIDTVVWKALSPGDRSAYGTPLRAIKQGLPGLCSCTCDACMDHFRGNSTWTPCPCRTTGRCTCRYRGAAKGKVAATSCDTECPVLGDRPLRSITTSDWIEMGFWAQARAAKRTESRNRARSRAGRALFDHDGRNAVESLHGALSKIYTFAIDTVPGVNRNLTEKLNTPERAPTGARAYSSVQLEQLWSAIVTSGGNDTELDMLLVWFLLETGSRRGGPLSVTMKDYKFHTNAVRLAEKGSAVAEQPIGEALLALLLRHALTRGDVIAANPAAIAVDEITLDDVRNRRVTLRGDEPAFYYKPKRNADGTITPHPLGRKRFDILWNRLRDELPWLEEMHGRPHDLRKTMGTFVERAHGHAVARGWLRHAVADTTGTYTQAAAEEVRRAHASIIGTQEGSP